MRVGVFPAIIGGSRASVEKALSCCRRLRGCLSESVATAIDIAGCLQGLIVLRIGQTGNKKRRYGYADLKTGSVSRRLFSKLRDDRCTRADCSIVAVKNVF